MHTRTLAAVPVEKIWQPLRLILVWGRVEPDVRLSMTIPGVSYYVELLVKAEIGDTHRLGSGGHLASHAGLVPSTRSSGGV